MNPRDSTSTGSPRREASPFDEGRIGRLALRNRFIKTATYEGMSPGGRPSRLLTEHHRALARGGVAMTTVAYCAVSAAGRTFADQMHMDAGLVPELRALTDAVHAEGAAASLQLGHCGGFSKDRGSPLPRPLGPSWAVNAYGLLSGLPLVGAMGAEDLRQVARDFATAAEGAVEAGFDAIELHYGHGYLLSQFLSPAVNRRRDAYGGALENRMRLGVEVLRAVRDRVGPDFPLLAKINLSDGFRGGLEVDEAVEVARILADEGIDAIVTSGGFTSRSAFHLLRGGRPLGAMIAAEPSWLQKIALALFGPFLVRRVPFEELFFLPEARRVRSAVDLPLVLVGGVLSDDGARRAMGEGFDFVALGRALIADPELVRELESGAQRRSRCISCNRCVAEMTRAHVRCVLAADDPGARAAR